MSDALASGLLTALAGWLGSLDALSGFTLTDRPGSFARRPGLRLGPVIQKPWDTGTSRGREIEVGLTLATREGTFGPLDAAIEAIASGLEDAPLDLPGAGIAVRRVGTIRTDHAPAQDAERASLTLIFLVDTGDLP